MADPEHDGELKDRVRRLLEFLRELVRARTRPVRDLGRHELVFWLADAEAASMVHLDAGQGDEVLRAARTTLEPAPEPPEELRQWVKPTDDGPKLKPEGPIKGWSQPIEFDAPAAARIRQAFDRYRTGWDAWAQLDRERRPRFEAYQALQRALQELDGRPESIELVVASGLLDLDDNGVTVHTHIVTQPAVIEKDVRTGDLVCRLVLESAPRLEDTQLLTGLRGFDASGSRAMQEALVTQCASPLDERLPAFLKEWAARALSAVVDVVTDAPHTRSVPAPRNGLRPSPALVLRRRGAFALVEYYERMIAAAGADDAAVPLGLAQLVEAIGTEERLVWLQRTGATPARDLAGDPLFPLPANGEQREILTRLGRDSGVVVEGPPGTGKTHTIANLVSALLARGQRVLVTSEKAQALRVLRDKLPPEMRELCVSITDVARGGSDELNRSVATLAARKASFGETSENARIDDLSVKRSTALRARAALLEEVRALRESETHDHPEVAPGYSGTAATVVRALTARRSEHEWLPTPVRTPNPPLDADELRRLIHLLTVAGPDWPSRRAQALPDVEAFLPEATQVRRYCDQVRSAPDAAASAAAPLLRALDGAPPAVLSRSIELCRALEAAVDDVIEAPDWVEQAADSLLSGQDVHLWSRAAAVSELAHRAVEADRQVGSAVVECGPPARPALAAYTALTDYIGVGGKWKKLFKGPEQKAVEQLGEPATVDGRPATTEADVAVVVAHLRSLTAVADVAAILEPLGVPVDITGSRPAQVNGLVRVAGLLRVAHSALGARDAVDSARSNLPARYPRMRNVSEARDVAAGACALAARQAAELAQAQLDEMAAQVESVGCPGPSTEFDALVTALRTADADAVVAARGAITVARDEQRLQTECDDLEERLSAGCPPLPALLRRSLDDPAWPTRTESLPQAWAWHRAMNWAHRRARPGREQQLAADLAVVESDLAQLTASLAAARAWRDCLRRMTALEVQALQAYRDNTTNVGMGTGKYAERFRSAARDAMRVAQGAVPAWVMPLQQVLASIPPVPDSFDVVIVDEASQADISSLFLLWLAPRVIVVGDDKQCTPSEISAGTLDDVFARLETYLPDMPEYLRSTLTPRSSVFSMLRTRFGQVVRLREHFRCMPEIITWSSQMFYRDAPLIPVRQHGANRLPPLRTTHVADAYVEGQYATLTNRVEAAAIVNAVERCLADEAYADKTFGVVVLQGQAQVDVIRTMLLRQIGQDEWDERRLRVGTPPDFQGDERHVVMLSMVVAPEQRFASLTKNEYQRRFNVAASRAQDQLWLFHSVPTDGLASTDLRRSLLTYMSSVSPAAADPMPEGVTRDRRQPPFESLFEQRIFLDITARGYHVNPQVEVNNRRLDLVVTGADAKLAVECDGDAWHSTPEQLQHDLDRELELRRCGWQFWRIRESEYYLDPEGSLRGLWVTLAERGIAATAVASAGGDTVPPWIPTALPDDDAPLTEAPEDAESAFTDAAHPVTTAVRPRVRAREQPEHRLPAARVDTALEVVMVAAESMELDSATVVRLTGLDGTTAVRLLAHLTTSGVLERWTVNGRTHYRKPV